MVQKDDMYEMYDAANGRCARSFPNKVGTLVLFGTKQNGEFVKAKKHSRSFKNKGSAHKEMVQWVYLHKKEEK